MRLEALSVDDRGSRLVVLLLRDPHLLEGRERGEDGTTDPYRVLSLGRGDDLDLHGGGSEGGELLLHSVGDTGEHSGTSREDDVSVQVLSDIDIALVQLQYFCLQKELYRKVCFLQNQKSRW